LIVVQQKTSRSVQFKLCHVEGSRRIGAGPQAVEWLIDTGAEVTIVTKATAAAFNLKLVGGLASTTLAAAAF
jgi:predicted Fe-Mo cluster-binding NifX family protein